MIALIAFFAGGFVAGRSAAAMRRGYGALNGFLVWALGVVVILALAAFGLGSLFGASGDLFAQYRALGSPTPEGVDAEAAAEGIRNSSIGALVAMVLPAVAAALGGWVGTRETAEMLSSSTARPPWTRQTFRRPEYHRLARLGNPPRLGRSMPPDHEDRLHRIDWRT